MQTLYLLDAYALIYRAYYALIRSPRINSKGQNTSAVYGFVNTLNDVLNTEKPDFIGPEVTGDVHFRNSHLLSDPFCNWRQLVPEAYQGPDQ